MSISSKLAIHGGEPLIKAPFAPYPSITSEEGEAVARVVRSGQLSGFYGSDGPMFLGGAEVRAFEGEWCRRFGVPHAVSVNSATSGLFAAMGAVGVGPGDEVIVPPTTMSATAMAPLVYGAIPVFADIDEETFCLDPARVREKISPRTKAIIAVNLFGHPARLAELRELADEKGLYLIEDNAQGPLASENGRLAGTVGHIGVFSLNYHKHIHTGEGGMCVTSDDRLAERLQLIRNHGENLAEPRNLDDLTNLVGFNYRMSELSAAVGRSQLAAADRHVDRRVAIAQHLSSVAKDLPGLHAPAVRHGCRHVYYLWTLRFDQSVVGVDRDIFANALEAEGFAAYVGYVRPLYKLPLFQKRIAIGRQGYPFNQSDVRYDDVLCPTAERLWKEEFICFETCAFDLDDAGIRQLGDALVKVYEHRAELSKG